MNKNMKKFLICGLVGLNLSFGMVNFASADTGVMDRLEKLTTRMEKLVTRMEKTSQNMPTYFEKSTLVDITNMRMTEDEHGNKRILGDISNNTGVYLDSVILEYEILDGNGNVLEDNTPVYIEKIKNGGKACFGIEVKNDKKATSFKLKSVKVEVDNIK